MDGERPLSLGEVLGENPAVLEGPGVKRVFEDVLRVETGAEMACYPEESVAGRGATGSRPRVRIAWPPPLTWPMTWPTPCRVSSSAPGQSLRDATIDWIRTHGLARGPAGAGDRSA